MTTAILDHVVINTRRSMDAAAAAFADLGFTLTPRGEHSLGSINHLMVFDDNYLELLGLPVAGPARRPELLEAPLGLDGVVFKTDDAEASFEVLAAADLADRPPAGFDRPVDLGDRVASARFRTVHARRDRCPEGRVYFCEHATPELVWRPEWQAHANGAQTIAEMVLVAADPAAVSARYAAISGGNPLITVLSPAALGDRYGVLARPLDGGAARLTALVVATDDLAAARTMAAAAPGVTLATLDDHRFAVRVDDFDTVIEFVTPAAARAIT